MFPNNFYTIFVRPLSVQYQAKPLSEASIFYLIVNLFRFIIPLVFVWNSDCFWLKESTFREMPDVDFTRQFIGTFHTKSTIDSSSNNIYGFSTFAHINEAFRSANQLIPIQIKDYELDYDYDEKLDELNIQLEVPFDIDKNQVYGFELYLFVRYRLEEKVNLLMESMVRVSCGNFEPGQRARVEGDLELIQRTPFFHKGFDFRYNQSLVVVDEDNMFTVENMLRTYAKRDYYTQLKPTVQYWEPYQKVLDPINPLGQPFRIDLSVNYRSQVFRYKTGFWYLLKWALVQYVAVYLMCDYVVRKVETYAYTNFVVVTVPILTNSRILRQTLSKDI